MTIGSAPEGLEIVEADEHRMVLSMGPQHPSTHGVLQVITEIEGETVMKAEPEIGYLPTGIEKSAENLFWTQASTVIERMDYLSPLSNAACFIMGVEQLLGITDEIPLRARQARADGMRPGQCAPVSARPEALNGFVNIRIRPAAAACCVRCCCWCRSARPRCS